MSSHGMLKKRLKSLCRGMLRFVTLSNALKPYVTGWSRDYHGERSKTDGLL
jgi:hypothetical protein